MSGSPGSKPAAEYAFSAEYARNGQERCHSTSEFIPRNQLMIGVIMQSHLGQRGTLWHLPEPFFSGGHQGLVSTILIQNFDTLRPADRVRIQKLIYQALRADDWPRRCTRGTAVTRAGGAADAQCRAMLVMATALLLLCEYVLPCLGVLERAGKAARLNGWRQVYTAINYARTTQLRLRWRCCRRRPPFEAAEVAPGLFIGSMADAHNLEGLQDRGIVAVVTVSPGIPPPFVSTGTIRYLCLDVIDLPDEPLTEHFCTLPPIAITSCRCGCDADMLERTQTRRLRLRMKCWDLIRTNRSQPSKRCGLDCAEPIRHISLSSRVNHIPVSLQKRHNGCPSVLRPIFDTSQTGMLVATAPITVDTEAVAAAAAAAVRVSILVHCIDASLQVNLLLVPGCCFIVSMVHHGLQQYLQP